MKLKITLFLLLAAVVPLIILNACSNGSLTNNSIPNTGVKNDIVPSRIIQAHVTGDIISIPVAGIERNINSKFTLASGSGTISFMAYTFGGNTHIRADICPPCRSQSFTLVKDTLVCDSCGTVFKAETGQGIRGACVAYPKESVAFEKKGSEIVMNNSDLLNAYKATLERG